MSSTNPTPEAESAQVVLLGAFNPAIFHPEWFLRQQLIDPVEAEEAEVKVLSPQVTALRLCNLSLQCVTERLSLEAGVIARAERLQDLMLNLLALLPHTPVTACGINARAHYPVASVELWHKIGHTLAPKEPVWRQLFEQPGMQSLTIKAPRAGEFPGEINITVEPSARFKPGIYLAVNWHFPLPRDMVHAGAAERVGRFLKAEWNEATGKARVVAEKIFSEIRLHNE